MCYAVPAIFPNNFEIFCCLGHSMCNNQYNHHGESFLIALQLQAITTEMVVYQVVYHTAHPDEFTFKNQMRNWKC